MEEAAYHATSLDRTHFLFPLLLLRPQLGLTGADQARTPCRRVLEVSWHPQTSTAQLSVCLPPANVAALSSATDGTSWGGRWLGSCDGPHTLHGCWWV